MALRGKKLETDQHPKKVSHPVSKHQLHRVLPKDNLKSGAAPSLCVGLRRLLMSSGGSVTSG